MLEFKEGEVIQTQLFTTKGILTYDVDWYRDGLYWANRSGQIQHTSLTQRKTQPVPTLLPGIPSGELFNHMGHIDLQKASQIDVVCILKLWNSVLKLF